jgi:hypothetical protein
MHLLALVVVCREESDGCKNHIKLTKAASPDIMIKPPAMPLTLLSPPESSLVLKNVEA